MSTDSEVRGSKLAQRVEEIEKLIRSGAVATGTSLASLLDSAQAQLDANRLEDEHLANDKKEKEQKDRSAIAAMVERETKLNEEEKKKYSEFLAKDYFTRSDFSDLSKFYADGGAYDRLSNDGKAEMSDRIEKGVQRGEFTRDELPMDVKRKDAEFRGTDDNQKAPRSDNAKTSAPVIEEPPPIKRSPEPASIPVKDSSGAAPEMPATPKPVEEPEQVSDVLAGLSKISPVKEASETSIPLAGRGSSGREIGG